MRLIAVLFILIVASIGAFLFFMRGYAKTPKALPKETATPSEDWVKDAVIYELFVRNFTLEGTLNAATARLAELQRLGATVVWLMPIHPIGEVKRKGSLGSPYSVKDYFDVSPDLGTKDDLKNFVAEAHRLGLKVILDVVINHTAWDNTLIKTNANFYTRDKDSNIVSPNKDWSDVADLNYAVPELRRYMTDMLLSWIRECDVDGYRCDVSELIPMDFWKECNAELRAAKPSLMLLSEGTLPEHHVIGFDLTYSWNVYDALVAVVSGKKPATALDEVLEIEAKVFPQNTLRLRFNTNHDKNAYDGTPTELYKGKAAAKTTAVLAFTLGGYETLRGVPMLYNGDEVGNTKRIGLFEKEPIEWKTENADEFRAFYTELIALRRRESALRRGTMTKLKSSNDEAVFAYERTHENSRVVVALNLRNAPFTGFLKVDADKTLLDVFDAQKEFATKDGNLRLSLNSFEHKIFVYKL